MPKRLSDYPDLDGRDYGLADFVAPETAAAAATVISQVSWCAHEQAIAALSVLNRTAQAPFLAPLRPITNDSARLKQIRQFADKAFESSPKRDLHIELSKLTRQYAVARNHLAHWLWYGDRKRPDLLLLSPELRVTTQWVQQQRHSAALKRHFKPMGGTTEAGWKAIHRAAKIDPPSDAIVYERSELEKIADHAQSIILGWQNFQRIVLRGSLALPRATAKRWEQFLRRDIKDIHRIAFPPPPQPLPKRGPKPKDRRARGA